MFEEYIGKRYGKLVVKEISHTNKKGVPVAVCCCDCGNINFSCSIDKLESEKIVSCKCDSIIDLTGQRFGRLLVVKMADKSDWKSLYGKKRVSWICQCDCGNVTIKRSHDLCYSGTYSCGCIRKERQHFANKSQIHRTWDTMLMRCYDKNRAQYYLYGGRGIEVCDEWLRSSPKGFSNFYNWAIKNGYKEEMLPNGKNKWTLDRIDADKGYSLDNCRWVTNTQQQNNKRADKPFEYNNETKTIKQWLRQYYFKCNDYYRLLRIGLTNKQVLDFISSEDTFKLQESRKDVKGERYVIEKGGCKLFDKFLNKSVSIEDFKKSTAY